MTDAPSSYYSEHVLSAALYRSPHGDLHLSLLVEGAPAGVRVRDADLGFVFARALRASPELAALLAPEALDLARALRALGEAVTR